jgi:polyisoprenoid-binding protein YceI
MIPKHKPSNLLKIEATLLQSQFVTKTKATDIPPQLKINPTKKTLKISAENQHFEETKTQKQAITGAIGTKLRRKEFAERKVEIKSMKEGC